MMNQDAPKRRRRWPWVFFGILVGVPMLAIVVLNILFSVNRIRPDQLQPRKDLLKATRQSETGTDLTTSSTATAESMRGTSLTSATLTWQLPKSPKDFAAVLAASPNQEFADLFAKLQAMKIRDDWQKGGFDKWRVGTKLNAEQTKWLVDHRAVIDDLLKLAKAGGTPIVTVEQMMALDPWARNSYPLLNYLEIQTYARILSAEAMRRFDSGDQAGAVEAILAINPIAKTTSEPWLISHLIAIASEQICNREVSRWLESGNLSPNVAREITDQLGAYQTTTESYRRVMENEYCHVRGMLTDMLNGSFSRMVQFQTQGNTNQSFTSFIYKQMLSDPLRLARNTGTTIMMRVNAAQTIDTFDSAYQATFESIDRGEIIDVPSERGNWWVPTPNFGEAQTRTTVSTALLDLDIAGLEMIAGKPNVERQDPFIEQPLKTVEESGSTLIYSVGPDRQDQHGGITYDPTNGTLSAGDIWVRVKK